MEDITKETTQAAQPAAAPGERRTASRPRQKKKKSKRTRILQRRLIVAGVALAIFLIIFSLGAFWGSGRGTNLTQENVAAQLADLADLSQTSYHYTNVQRFEGVDDFYGWDSSDYSSGFTLSYAGVVTASVDPKKAEVEVKGKTVTVTLPEAAISANEITEDSLAVYNGNQGDFTAIQVTDFAGFKDNQEPVAEAKATADGLLFDASDRAKAAAQALLETLAGDPDKYDIVIK